MSWGLKEWIWILRKLCLEINVPRGVLFNPYLIAILWYEYGKCGKVLQRCVMNLLQWVWLNKPSEKLIPSSHESQSIATSWYERENSGNVLQRCVTNFLQWVWLDKPSDKFIQLSHLTIWMSYHWVELRLIEQEKGGMPSLYMEKSRKISHPSRLRGIIRKKSA